MNATSCIVKIGQKYVQLTEQQLQALNNLIKDCPVGGSYEEDTISETRRTQLKATLTIENTITE